MSSLLPRSVSTPPCPSLLAFCTKSSNRLLLVLVALNIGYCVLPLAVRFAQERLQRLLHPLRVKPQPLDLSHLSLSEFV